MDLVLRASVESPKHPVSLYLQPLCELERSARYGQNWPRASVHGLGAELEKGASRRMHAIPGTARQKNVGWILARNCPLSQEHLYRT